MRAMPSLAALPARGPPVVTHGNGPQVGLLALQAAAYDGAEPYPLDVLCAETEGMIGYLLEQEPRNVLPGREVATLLTQVVVDPDDQAFSARPSRSVALTASGRPASCDEHADGRSTATSRPGDASS